jgi:hypothetical protein
MADQIGEHMSWQLLDEQPEWEPETDQLLHLLPIVGCVFRKTYFDPSKGRNASLMVSPMKFVVNYHAKSLETAPRSTESSSSILGRSRKCSGRAYQGAQDSRMARLRRARRSRQAARVS